MTDMDAMDLEIERNALDDLLRDQDWYDAEFLAIMAASGFAARTAVTLFGDGRDPITVFSTSARRLLEERPVSSSSRSRARVRSPPPPRQSP